METFDQAEIAIRANCSAIIAAFAHHVDHREFDSAVALFAEDGAFIRPDLQARGTVEIARIWEGRPESLVTKHIHGLPHFTKIADDRASAVTTFTLYTLNWDGAGLPTFNSPAAIVEYHDEFIKTPSGWRIQERKGVPLLVFAAS